MDTWVSAIIFIILFVVFAVIFYIAIRIKILKVKTLKSVNDNMGKKTGGIMPEDIGDMILGCLSAH